MLSFVYLQIEGPETRPRSIEGPPDSGISNSGDIGSSPDSDNSTSNTQSQNVSFNFKETESQFKI